MRLTVAQVQRVRFEDRPPTYTVVGVDKLPVAPAREYLTFLRNQGGSPNTLRAYAYGLAAWWTVLEGTGTAWDDFPTSLFGQFLAYLRTGDLPGVARIGEPEQRLAESSLLPRSAAVLSMYRYFANAHDLVRPYRRLYASHARTSRRGRYAPFLAGVGPKREQDGPIHRLRGLQRAETPVLTSLTTKTGSLMGGNPGVPFALLAPVAQVSESARPKFRWQALDGAVSYTVTVYNAAFNKVATSPLLTTTEWQPAQPLPRGLTYSWQVKALKDGQEIAAPVPPAPEAKFKVLEPSKLQEVTNARRQFAGSHLALGLLYAEAGLLPEAERELQALVEANRTSTLARKLLQSVKAAAP